MKHKKILLIALICLIGIGISVPLFSGHRPFKNLTAEDITSANVRLSPPDTTIQISETEELEELASYLNEVVIYNKDNSYTEYVGQGAIFTLSLADGSQVEIIEFNPFIIIDGTGYKCKYEPCEALNNYANRLLPDNDTTNFLMPEEGYYSNEYDEILRIKKEDDGTYNILEYGITHLLYVENAVGIYNSETGILEFSGKDDRGNDIKAEIENKGDCLEVTVIQSSYEDIIGTKQEFFQVENNISEQNSTGLQWDIIPMVMVNNKLYYDTGKESTLDGRCGVMDGKIISTVDGSEIPTQNDQSNFGTGFEYQYGSDDTIEIFMNEKLDEMTRELLLMFDGTDPEEIDRLRNEWLAELESRKSEFQKPDRVVDYVNVICDVAIEREKRRMQVA